MQEEEKIKGADGEEKGFSDDFSQNRAGDSPASIRTEHVFWDYEDFAGGREKFEQRLKTLGRKDLTQKEDSSGNAHSSEEDDNEERHSLKDAFYRQEHLPEEGSYLRRRSSEEGSYFGGRSLEIFGRRSFEEEPYSKESSFKKEHHTEERSLEEDSYLGGHSFEDAFYQKERQPEENLYRNGYSRREPSYSQEDLFEEISYTDEHSFEEEDDRDTDEENGNFNNFRVDTGGVFDGEEEEALFASLNESLMRQVAEELDKTPNTAEGIGEEMAGKKKKGKMKKVLTVLGCLVLVLALVIAFLVGTRPGRKIVINFAAKFIALNVNHKEPSGVVADLLKDYAIRKEYFENGEGPIVIVDPFMTVTPVPEDAEEIRKEDYVKNILIFGIDQGDMDSVHSGSLNTDTIMIATINTKDRKVKITSILRDMYVELGNGVGHKINSVYAIGNRNKQGPELLLHTVENYFKIDLMGYAYVKLSAFEDVVNILGGVSIDLGSKEANYLNTTNYITDPRNRNLKSGLNHMNGNQVAGYCRIRKVETLGGATNDYGRTLRQRRVLQAIFQKYKSQSIMNLIPVTQKCLSKITTNLGEAQISELLEMFVEEGISEMESYRLPLNDSFYDSGKKGYNGITYGLVIDDIEANVVYLYEHLYADTPEEAKANYDALKH